MLNRQSGTTDTCEFRLSQWLIFLFVYRIRDVKQRSFDTLCDPLIQFEFKYFEKQWGIEYWKNIIKDESNRFVMRSSRKFRASGRKCDRIHSMRKHPWRISAFVCFLVIVFTWLNVEKQEAGGKTQYTSGAAAIISSFGINEPSWAHHKKENMFLWNLFII